MLATPCFVRFAESRILFGANAERADSIFL